VNWVCFAKKCFCTERGARRVSRSHNAMKEYTSFRLIARPARCCLREFVRDSATRHAAVQTDRWKRREGNQQASITRCLTRVRFDRILPSMLFLVLSSSIYDLRFAQAIQAKFPGKFIALTTGQWLVAGDGTTKDISDRLGITNDAPNAQIELVGQVFSISGYYGRAPSNIWEWIAANWK
jgi:hypothetical protein